MVACLEAGNAGADLLDHADALMAEHAARLAGRHVALEYVQVGAADGGLGDPDHGIGRRLQPRHRPVLDGGPNVVEEVGQITGGGAHVVIDFVGELGVENICWKMVRKGGQLFVVGYGGNINVPTAHLVIEEINIGGSLVGNFTELVELMELNADGKVKMHYTEYNLASINTALDDFKNRRFTGRGVIVP